VLKPLMHSNGSEHTRKLNKIRRENWSRLTKLKTVFWTGARSCNPRRGVRRPGRGLGTLEAELHGESESGALGVTESSDLHQRRAPATGRRRSPPGRQTRAGRKTAKRTRRDMISPGTRWRSLGRREMAGVYRNRENHRQSARLSRTKMS
jgi:hypothetical protein